MSLKISKKLSQNFQNCNIKKIQSGASKKKFYRLGNNFKTYILTDFNTDKNEYKNYIKIYQLLKEISAVLLEGMAIRNSTEDPIAFGLVALIVDIKFENEEGSMEELENLLNSIENISQIEVKAVSKLSTSV